MSTTGFCYIQQTRLSVEKPQYHGWCLSFIFHSLSFEAVVFLKLKKKKGLGEGSTCQPTCKAERVLPCLVPLRSFAEPLSPRPFHPVVSEPCLKAVSQSLQHSLVLELCSIIPSQFCCYPMLSIECITSAEACVALNSWAPHFGLFIEGNEMTCLGM